MAELPEGAGRIRREFYCLHIGNRGIDVDELRVYFGAGTRVGKLVRLLDPPVTRDEYDWVCRFFEDSSIALKEFHALVPAPVAIRRPAWYTTLFGAIRSWFSVRLGKEALHVPPVHP